MVLLPVQLLEVEDLVINLLKGDIILLSQPLALIIFSFKVYTLPPIVALLDTYITNICFYSGKIPL